MKSNIHKKETHEDKFSRRFACWVKNNPKAWRFWKRKTRKDYRHKQNKKNSYNVVMTYFELLEHIKNGTQPNAIRNKIDGVCFHWFSDIGYVSENEAYEHIHDDFTDNGLLTEDYIEVVD